LHALTIRGRARWLDRQSAAWLTVVERPAVQHAALQLLSDSRFKVTVVDKALQESAGERGDYVIDIASAGVKHEDHGEQQSSWGRCSLAVRPQDLPRRGRVNGVSVGDAQQRVEDLNLALRLAGVPAFQGGGEVPVSGQRWPEVGQGAALVQVADEEQRVVKDDLCVLWILPLARERFD
jgi:hypothetical protein